MFRLPDIPFDRTQLILTISRNCPIQYIPKIHSSGDMIRNDGNPLLLIDAISPPPHNRRFDILETSRSEVLSHSYLLHVTALKTRRARCCHQGIALSRHVLPFLDWVKSSEAPAAKTEQIEYSAAKCRGRAQVMGLGRPLMGTGGIPWEAGWSQFSKSSHEYLLSRSTSVSIASDVEMAHDEVSTFGSSNSLIAS